MRLYPRMLYKGNDTLRVENESEEMKASSDGWDCARTPEKIALKESKGDGVLREQIHIEEQIKTVKKVIKRKKAIKKKVAK